MHHCFLCHGLRAFFEMPAHALVGQRRNQSQFHRLARKGPQRPVVISIGSRGAGQGDEMGPGPVIQLAVPVGLGPVLKHSVQAVLRETPLGAVYAGLGRVQSLGHLGSRSALAGLEQDAGPRSNSGRTPASPHQTFQPVTFLRGEPDRKLLSNHTGTSQQHQLPATIPPTPGIQHHPLKQV